MLTSHLFYGGSKVQDPSSYCKSLPQVVTGATACRLVAFDAEIGESRARDSDSRSCKDC